MRGAAIEVAKEKVFQKPGRNLHLFQEAEDALPVMVTRQGLAGAVEDLAKRSRRQGTAVAGQTMGTLLKPALEGPGPVDEGESERDVEGGATINLWLRPAKSHPWAICQNVPRPRWTSSEYVSEFVR